MSRQQQKSKPVSSVSTTSAYWWWWRNKKMFQDLVFAFVVLVAIASPVVTLAAETTTTTTTTTAPFLCPVVGASTNDTIIDTRDPIVRFGEISGMCLSYTYMAPSGQPILYAAADGGGGTCRVHKQVTSLDRCCIVPYGAHSSAFFFSFFPMQTNISFFFFFFRRTHWDLGFGYGRTVIDGSIAKYDDGCVQ